MFTINQGFDLNSPQFNFKRDYFASTADLKAAAESGFPNYFITNVAGTLYQFNSSNPVDTNTGKWRKFNVSGYINDSNYAKLNTANTFSATQKVFDPQQDNSVTITTDSITVGKIDGSVTIGNDGIRKTDGGNKELFATDGSLYDVSTLEDKASTNANSINTLNTTVKSLNDNFDSKAQAAANTVINNKAGKANGLAQLDANGKVPSNQLPSYVDDVLEYDNLAAFPATGETGKIYTAKNTNKIYRWSGSAYVVISETIALGETSSTAFPGNRGKVLENQMTTKADNSALANYLPLSGGTITNGDLSVLGKGVFNIYINEDGLSIEDEDNIRTFYNPSVIINNGKSINLPSNAGTIALTSDIPNVANKVGKVNVTGSGNAVTSASVSGDTLTLTKGANFLTNHQDISGKSDKTHTHSVKINGVTKTIAATGGEAVDLGTYLVSSDVAGKYLPLTGGTLTGNLLFRGENKNINIAESFNSDTDNYTIDLDLYCDHINISDSNGSYEAIGSDFIVDYSYAVSSMAISDNSAGINENSKYAGFGVNGLDIKFVTSDHLIDNASGINKVSLLDAGLTLSSQYDIHNKKLYYEDGFVNPVYTTYGLGSIEYCNNSIGIYTIKFPDKSGTIALTSDIPTIPSNLAYTNKDNKFSVGQTFNIDGSKLTLDSDGYSIWANSSDYTQLQYGEIYYRVNDVAYEIKFPTGTGVLALTSDIKGYVTANVQALTNDEIDKALA